MALRRLACGFLAAAALHVEAASMAPVTAANGMVVTAQHLATEVGVDVLKRGGNAIDAAVAVGYALAVAWPSAGNLGGGGFMTLHLAQGGERFIDFREKAPLAAWPDMYLDAQGKVRAGASLKGALAVATPGTVAGLELAREKYGTMKRDALMAPAIALAEKGFVLEVGDVEALAGANEDLRKDAASAAIFLRKDGSPLAVGDRLVQRDLARTLREIARHGAVGFYAGPVAKALVDANRAGGGILAAADLERYRPRELAPVECDYRGFHVVSAPPPSSGGVILCEMLNILEGYPLRELGYRSARAVHYQVEAMRHAYFDRNAYLGDPDFVKNPVARLLDKDYAARLRKAIDPAHAGSAADFKPGVAPHEGTNTTHYSIVDRWGNAVAVTYTLNASFGARVTAAGTGVVMNDEMDDFTIKGGEANRYGLVQGAPNVIAPGKTPLSSMAPTIVTRDGKPLIVLGTPGGSLIISAVLLTLLNVIDYGMDIQEAVDAPRFHQQGLPATTRLERFALSPDTRRALEAMGHQFREGRPANHVAAILLEAPALGAKPVAGARLYGANDPRGHTGLAAGY
jgi:gamma-glutamyltranspeptidase/glutathione hydrolase